MSGIAFLSDGGANRLSVTLKIYANKEEYHCLCDTIELGERKSWFMLNRRGGIVVPVSVGARVSLIVDNGSQAMKGEGTICEIRGARTQPEFAVEMPREWEMLSGRSAPRVQADIPALIVREEDIRAKIERTFTAQILDLSVSGARILSRVPFSKNNAFFLQFELPETFTKMAIVCQVKRSIGDTSANARTYEFAVSFIKMSVDNSQQLERFINSQIQFAAA